ncbi:sensor histidine kinase [Actinomadura rudentiformis]|uniref:Sensor histidine kinase n=1 Tax=Actinomadura rudentiformis TaxID=359158 RepID=A0A6H9YM28_9ACTN|nr:sensor histidine kinase [Actinomadura rudentiformis]KAB2347762.1 sensor histidine kinase [Actinomadura rudentiformis]
MSATLDTAEPFVHPALFYRGTDEYIAGTVPFIEEGLMAGQPVAVAVPGHRLELLHGELGSAAGQVKMIDMTVAGRNPGRIIPGVLRAFADSHRDARHVRIIGEPIWAGRTATEYPACVQHEALINLAFTGRPVTILCPYDAIELDPRVLDDAALTHPTVIDNAKTTVSTAYDPGAVIQAYNRPLPGPGPGARYHVILDFDVDNLVQAREAAADIAVRAGLTPAAVGDLEIAVNELAANSVRHGGGRGTLEIWADSALVCQVSDAGHLTDPLAGRKPVGLSGNGGRGLLMVNHIADLLRVHTGPNGTTIQARFSL